MSGTSGGGVTVPTVPVPVSMGGTGSSTGDATLNSVTLTGAGPSTKKLFLTGNNFFTLLNSNGSTTDMSVDSGGTVAAAGNVVAFGNAANSVTLAGAATGGNVLLGVTTGSTGPNLGAVIGNIKGTGALMAQVPDSDYVLTAAVLAGGTGYTVGDILTVVGGTGTAASVRVTTVSSGVVTGVAVNSSGAYSVQPSGTPATTGGTGTSCTLTLTYAITGTGRGANAVDLQTVRTLATRVASGANSIILGGAENATSGQYSSAIGYFHIVTGRSGVALGEGCFVQAAQNVCMGFNAQDHGIKGAVVQSSGGIVASGDAQSGTYVLRGRSTGGAAVRLTADGGAANSINVCNLPLNTSWAGDLSVTARDTSTGNCFRWKINAGLAVVATAATTAYVEGSVEFVNTIGTVGAVSQLTRAADTSNPGSPSPARGALNLTFTPPNSNTWNIVAVFRTAEVQ